VKRHADAEMLAAYHEGLLPRRRARRVAAHLADCQQCAGLDTQLARLPGLLASSPAPPMPAALTARIEAALAAEAAARSAVPAAAAGPAAGAAAGTATGETQGPSRGLRGPRHTRPVVRIAVGVAAAAVVIGGAGYGLSQLTSGGTPRSSPVAGPAAVPSKNGGRKAEHGTVGPSSAGLAPAGLPGGLRVVYSGTDYQPGSLQGQVGAVLTKLGGGQAPARGGANRASPVDTHTRGLQACVTHIAGNHAPLLVDVARYRGRLATVIVVPITGESRLRVWVVGPGCSATARDVLASTTLPGGG
jgi:hypothetical protein